MTVSSVSALQSFKSNGRNELSEKSFVMLPDKQIRQLAKEKTEQIYPGDSFRKKTNALYYSLPLLGGIATAAAVKGSPARKAIKGAKSGALWAGALGILGLYNKASNAVVERSPKLKEQTQKHPFASTILDLSLAFAGVDAGTRLLNKGLSAVKVPRKVINNINNSKLVKNIIPDLKNGFGNIVSKAPEFIQNSLPKVKKAGTFVVKNSPLIAIGGLLLAGVGHSLKKEKIYNSKYNEVKDLQLSIAQDMISDKAVRDI